MRPCACIEIMCARFHVHVLDFEVRDWTRYDEGNPIKSHEVARFLYTRHVKRALGGFDDPHFKLSCDPMRMITFPGSLNSRSGLICTYLGGPSKFERMSITDVLHRSRALRYIFNDGFRPLVRARAEDRRVMKSDLTGQLRYKLARLSKLRVKARPPKRLIPLQSANIV